MIHSSPRLWLWAAAESARAIVWIALALFLGCAQLQPLRPPIRSAMAFSSLIAIGIGQITRLRARDRWRYFHGWSSADRFYLQGRDYIDARSSPPTPPALEPAIQAAPTSDQSWLTEILGYPSVLIWGPPGSGKSTFAGWLIKQRMALGHRVEILDPHREYGQWSGLNVVGDGLNYLAINDRLAAFMTTVADRYQRRATEPNYRPAPLTVLAEEFTQWGKKCANSAEFFEVSVSDIRKISCHVVYVSHSRTLAGLGGATGLAKTRDAALLELELIAVVDPKTGAAAPLGRGILKYPGGRQVEVQLPNISGFPNVQDNGFPWVPSTKNPEPNIEPGAEPKPEPIEQARSLLAQGLQQDEIIRQVWGAKKGGGKAYIEARDIVRQLKSEISPPSGI